MGGWGGVRRWGGEMLFIITAHILAVPFKKQTGKKELLVWLMNKELAWPIA